MLSPLPTFVIQQGRLLREKQFDWTVTESNNVITTTKEGAMKISYKKLWKLLIDKDMKKKDLCEKACISPASITKMSRNGHVTTVILQKICGALDCQIGDIVEIIPDE